MHKIERKTPEFASLKKAYLLDIFFCNFKRRRTIKKSCQYMKLALRVVWVSWPQDSQTLVIYPFTNLPSFPVQLTCVGEAMLLWITRCLGISTMMVVLVHKLTPSYSQSQLFRKSFPRVVNFFVKRYTSSYHDLGWHKNQIFVFTLKTPMQPKKSSSFDRWDKNMSQKCRILGYGDLYP